MIIHKTLSFCGFGHIFLLSLLLLVSSFFVMFYLLFDSVYGICINHSYNEQSKCALDRSACSLGSSDFDSFKCKMHSSYESHESPSKESDLIIASSKFSAFFSCSLVLRANELGSIRARASLKMKIAAHYNYGMNNQKLSAINWLGALCVLVFFFFEHNRLYMTIHFFF